MTSVSTHILDTAAGSPAAGVLVSLSVWAEGAWHRPGERATDADGRVTGLPAVDLDAPATVRLIFAVEDYLTARHGTAFFPEITVAFTAGPGEHYHVPLLLSPFGYSTYRGS
jgi:hydroxyisourate hydrolase